MVFNLWYVDLYIAESKCSYSYTSRNRSWTFIVWQRDIFLFSKLKQIESSDCSERLLKPFKEVILFACKDKFPSLAIVIPLLQSLKNRHYLPKTEDLPCIALIREVTRAEIVQRYGDYKHGNAMITFALDPRWCYSSVF